jgi:hypothetical protein
MVASVTLLGVLTATIHVHRLTAGLIGNLPILLLFVELLLC